MRPTTRSFWTAVFSLMLVITSIAQPIAAQDLPVATPVVDETETPTATKTPVPTEVSTTAPEKTEPSRSSNVSRNSISAQAEPTVEYSVPDPSVTVDPAQPFTVSITVIPDETMIIVPSVRTMDGAYFWKDFDNSGVFYEPDIPVEYIRTIPADDIAVACSDGGFTLMLEVIIWPIGASESFNLGQPTWDYTCLPQLVTPSADFLQVNAAICGNQNDEVTYSQANVTVASWSWNGNSLVFNLQANTGYTFADGTTTTITYTDAGNCIIQEQIPRPIQVDQCGLANDNFEHGGELPTEVNPAFTVRAAGNTLTVTYTAQTGYAFPGGSSVFSFDFTDENTSCDSVITEQLTPPTIVQQCGALNDTVTPASSQPGGVVVQPDVSQYSETGVITLTYSAAEGYVFADGYNNVIEHTDQGDNCPVLTIDIDDTTFEEIPTEGNLIITGSLVLDGVDLNDATNQQLFLNGTEANFWSRLRDGSTWRYEWRAANSELRAMCTDGQMQVSASVDVTMYGVTETYSIDSYTVPCSLGADSIVVIPTGEVTQIEVCGTTDQQINDIITLVPQEGVAIESETWGNGEYLIYLEPAQGYVFPPGTETLVRTRDNATQCEPSTLGFDESSQVLMNVQVGQEVTLTATLNLPEGNPHDAANLTLRMAGTGEELPVSLTPTLGTGGVLPVEFTYTIPANFADVCSTYSSGMPMELTAYLTGPTYSDPVGFTESLMSTAALPCSLADVVTPDVDLIVQAEVCGDANDTFSTSQEGVELTLGDWADNRATITFTAAEGYVFPDGSETSLAVTDDGPCVVTPLQPTMTETVCGPDNDIITIPDQPEGVILHDSGWQDGNRNISWTPADGYLFPETVPGGMIALDRNTSCDQEPVDTQLTVILNTSDGGSIEGTPYQLFAPVASQTVPLPYEEGVVSSDNRIVFEGLLPGEYRLVIAPEGYEPIDMILAVTEGEEQQEITVDIAAIQEPETPTPEPTVPTTPEPTAPTTPAAEPTVEPNATKQAVSGLPETGTGTGSNSMFLSLIGILSAAMIVTVIGFRGNRSRLG